jgi:hypothetical protein
MARPARLSSAIRAMAICTAVLCPAMALSQNFTSGGQNWSSGWSFPSPSDRSLALQQAQAIRQATIQPGPSTVVTNYNNTVNDTRSNYQEILGETMTFDTIDFQLNGDRIGQNTNSIGAMNTGTTNIEVSGSNNEVIATNAADSEGCVDGSIQQESQMFESMASPSGIDISVGSGSAGRVMRCAR